MREIGSEFWNIELSQKENNMEFLKMGKESQLFMSGRTAIDYVLEDIEDSKKIVYMPDYCCISMLQPFIDRDYTIKYYKVDLINEEYIIDFNIECSIFFAMSYFGYSKSCMDDCIEKFSKKGIIIIEDITHRFLSNINYCNNSTYLICSLRKWFPIISGGLAVKIKGNFNAKRDKYKVDKDFIERKYKAMKLKERYIHNKIQDKNEYMKLFVETNKLFNNYKNKAIDDISLNILKHLNIDDIKQKRINNAKCIELMLKDSKEIKLIYNFEDGDVPLFVPALLEKRDILRNELINNNIYCPIHWPNELNLKNEIYNKELSLICDQRYSIKDIKDYINIILNILGV